MTASCGHGAIIHQTWSDMTAGSAAWRLDLRGEIRPGEPDVEARAVTANDRAADPTGPSLLKAVRSTRNAGSPGLRRRSDASARERAAIRKVSSPWVTTISAALPEELVDHTGGEPVDRQLLPQLGRQIDPLIGKRRLGEREEAADLRIGTRRDRVRARPPARDRRPAGCRATARPGVRHRWRGC